MEKIENKKKKTKFIITERFKKIYIPIICSLSALFVLSIILICVIPSKNVSQKFSNDNKKTFKSGWKTQIVAPFIDLSSWVDTNNAYSLNGVPNIAKVEEDTGITFYNIGFIQPDTDTPLDQNGNIRYGFGGYYSLSEKGNDNFQYPNIKKSIENLKKLGGIYTISVGGQLGDAPWVVTQNVEKLENFYQEIIDTYALKRLDLDIEESNQGETENKANAKAIKQIQDKNDTEIVLTIPIMPNGWQEKQLKIIKAYLDEGVDISLFNSMTMCYGTGVLANEDYGDASIRAIENSIKQMKEIYAQYDKNLSTKEAYAKTGATIDIGYESNLYPVFTLEMAKKVVDHAKENQYGMLSYWSINRDAKMVSNQAITELFTYLDVMNDFYK